MSQLAGERVLVTGGSGFIGQRLVQALVQQPQVAEVRILTRAAVRGRAVAAHPGLTWVEGDLRAPETWAAALPGTTVVYHLAGLKPEAQAEQDQAAFMAVNRDATVQLARGAADHGVRRFVFFSSTGVFGDAAGPRLTEETECRPATAYEQSKLAAERALEEAAGRLPVEIISLRPSNVFGETHPRRHLLTFLNAVRRGWLLLPVPAGAVNFVYVDDVVAAAVRLGLWPQRLPAAPGRYILNCPRPADEFAAEAARVLGVPAAFPRLPVGLLRGLGAASDWLARFARRRLPLTRRKVEELADPRYFESLRLPALLPDWPPVGLAAGLRRTVEHYRQQGWL